MIIVNIILIILMYFYFPIILVRNFHSIIYVNMLFLNEKCIF